MPALPDVASVIRITTKLSVSGGSSDIISRWFMKYTGTAPTNADLNTLAAAVVTHWGVEMKGLFHSAYHLTEVEIVDLTSPSAAVGLASASVAGTRSGEVLSAAAAVCVQYKIGRRYRGGHPRSYWPMGVQGDLADVNTWDSTMITSSEADVAAFIADVAGEVWSGGGTLTHVNVSYYDGFTNVTGPTGRARAVPTLRVTPVVDDVAGYNTNPQVASQRRRNQQ